MLTVAGAVLAAQGEGGEEQEGGGVAGEHEARDGTSGQTVHAIIDCALAGCDTAAARPTRLRG